MNLDQFSVVVDEDTRAINPQTSLGEQNAFIENLRNTQAQQNAEIQQQTHDLGTDVPSQLGGLTGGEGYFQARYQTPYTNAAVGDLRAAAQAQALSEAFDLELARANARYNAASKAARERAARRARYSYGRGGNNTTTPTNNVGEDVLEEATDRKIGRSEEWVEKLDTEKLKKNIESEKAAEQKAARKQAITKEVTRGWEVARKNATINRKKK